MDLVECLGVEGTLGVAPPTAGWGAPMELIGSGVSLTLLPLSIVAGVITLVIGVTGNIDFPFNWLKESKECEFVFPSKFPGCASACSLKCKDKDLGLIIDLVLLNMELSGNLTQ